MKECKILDPITLPQSLLLINVVSEQKLNFLCRMIKVKKSFADESSEATRFNCPRT